MKYYIVYSIRIIIYFVDDMIYVLSIFSYFLSKKNVFLAGQISSNLISILFRYFIKYKKINFHVFSFPRFQQRQPAPKYNAPAPEHNALALKNNCQHKISIKPLHRVAIVCMITGSVKKQLSEQKITASAFSKLQLYYKHSSHRKMSKNPVHDMSRIILVH